MSGKGEFRGFLVEKVVANWRGMVYNVWTSKRFAKKRCGVSGGYLNDY
jgi:hypothetical protein